MDYKAAIEQMTHAQYEALKRAVELGKWPNGEPVSPDQRQNALQAVIAWGELHLPPEDRVGFIDRSKKTNQSTADVAQVLNFNKDSE
jgi:uncharacterized protein YeaC (DUF1315 family)